MLLCPAQTQTSPERILRRVVFSPSLKVMERGVKLAAGVLTLSSHFPSLPALTVYFREVQDAVIWMFFPG
jgi:hypothetical protein